MCRQRRAELAALPSQRNLGFLCDYFKLLPTDPRIGDMTEEQVADLFLQIAHLHPTATEEVMRDEEYEQELAALEAEQAGVLDEETLVTEEWEEIADPGA